MSELCYETRLQKLLYPDSLSYCSCLLLLRSDVLLNRKQLNSGLQNAVAPNFYMVWFQPDRFWSVYWVNILKPCFDAGITHSSTRKKKYFVYQLVDVRNKTATENDFQNRSPTRVLAKKVIYHVSVSWPQKQHLAHRKWSQEGFTHLNTSQQFFFQNLKWHLAPKITSGRAHPLEY